jgi:hypothetical protein
VTGPSAYARSSWARALSESEEAARHMDKKIVFIIFYSPVVIHPDFLRNMNSQYSDAGQKITQIHYGSSWKVVGKNGSMMLF